MALRTVWLSPDGALIVVGLFGMESTDKYELRGEYDLSYDHKYWPEYKKLLKRNGYQELGAL